jgi:hypothetical protein
MSLVPTNQSIYQITTGLKKPPNLFSALWIAELDSTLPGQRAEQLFYVKMDSCQTFQGAQECNPACFVRTGKKFLFQYD